jgi:YD repeat-containing protein
MKRLAILLTLFTGTIIARGQVNNFNQSPVTIQSPDATQFIRYGNIPVDYSTGVPNISIPIHNITSGSLSLPVDISYNASGIKVQDIAGTAGLGWNLNAGGLVSRTVLGTKDVSNSYKPDLFALYNQAHNTTTYNNVCNFTNTVEQTFTQNALQLETQSDRYFYSFNGRSGIFRVDFQTGVAKTIPYSPLKIVLNNTGTYKITAEDGTNYYFEQPELTGSSNSSAPSYTSYYLTKIESPDLTHSINIYYKQDAEVYQYIKNYQLERSVSTTGLAAYGPYVNTEIHNNEFRSMSVPVMPDSITSDNETILFQYIADRPDLRSSRLNSIKILNRTTRETIKIIELQQSYFGTAVDNNQRLKLNNVSIKDNGNTTVQQYSFGYNSTPLPPYYHSFGMTEHHNVDYWGYYNGADDPNLLPRELFNSLPPGIYLSGSDQFTFDEKTIYGGTRDLNPSTVQACMLTSITYPTGGKTDFEYELNKVSNGYSYPNSPGEDFGGLRVKKITSTADAASSPVVKTYKYIGGFHTTIETDLYQYKTASTTFGSSQGLGTLNNTSSIICTDPFMPMNTGIGPLVIYDYVTEYDGTEANNNGYTEYEYDNYNIPYQFYDPAIYGSPSFGGFYLTDYGNYRPQLKSKVIYGRDQNNIIKEIKREGYTYNKYNSGSFITGVKVQRNNPYVKLGQYSYLTDCDFATGCTNIQICLAQLLNSYWLSNTIGILDVPLLTQKKETIHPSTGTGGLITTTDYTYDLSTLQPIKEQSINSKGETLISQSKYPTDFSSAAPYNTMISKNILTPVIEQTSYKNIVSNPNFLNSTKTNYDYWNGSNWSTSPTNIIVPRTVDSKSKDQSAYETRMRYYSYDDKGNPTTVLKENDVKKTYLWGYNKNYPVAEIIGADYATASTYFTQSVLDNPVSDASMRNHLNNLRNIPGAFVTTYTYKPSVGITSQTDPNGRTIYYEYDAFNRLVIIRDKDNNVIKKICYNYAGQPENCTTPCPPNSPPNWQNTTAPPTCQQGSCGNTGYQLQEQRDMNTCSPTYNQTQTVLVYNPTACPSGTGVTITYQNFSNYAGYTAVYTSRSNGQVYSFTIPTGGTGTLGCIPADSYTLGISKPGSNLYLLFGSGCHSAEGASVLFGKVIVNSMSSCTVVSLAPGGS